MVVMKYRYQLVYRPFSIGVYPTASFLKWEDDGSRFGVLVYSRELTEIEMHKYELRPL